MTLQSLATEVQRRQEAAVDYLAPTSSLLLLPPIQETVEPGGDDFRLNATAMGDAFQPAPLRETAHAQLGTHIGIPRKYYRRMQAEAPGLLVGNVNHWLKGADPDERRMLRVLDGRVRAFLSSSYRRLDNYDLLQALIPTLLELTLSTGGHDLHIASCHVGEDRLYLKVLFKGLEADVGKGDTVQAGVSITNSETGRGSFNVLPMVYRLVCTNGLIAPVRGFSRRHVGKNVQHDGNLEHYRDETIQADDEAFWMKCQDTVRAAADEAIFTRTVNKMRDASEEKLAGDVPAAIEQLGKSLGFTQGEGSDILRHLIEGGDTSRWGVVNAVTRTAEDSDSYERATTIEEAGGSVLFDDSVWRAIRTAQPA
jgi:hypothetical protein